MKKSPTPELGAMAELWKYEALAKTQREKVLSLRESFVGGIDLVDMEYVEGVLDYLRDYGCLTKPMMMTLNTIHKKYKR